MKPLLKSTPVRYFLYLLALTPLFLFRDFTLNNELRYLSIADEALRNHSFFTFSNHGIQYADKPPLYLWIVMLGKIVFGTHSLLFLGLFSLLPALVILHTMDRWVKNYLSPDQRLSAEMMLFTSSFFIGTAIVLRMDMLMCMFIVLALFLFYKMYSRQGKPIDSILFPLCIFMAIFSKGPIGFIVPLVSTLVFLLLKKEIKTIGRYWGLKSLALILILCSAWFTGVYAEGGKQYFNDLLFHQTLNRAVNSFHHNEPFYYYLLAIWYSLFPWSLLVITTLITGLIQKLVTNDLERFFLVISLSTLAILSLFSAKLAVYMLPSFPFILYLCVMWLSKYGSPRWALWLVAIPAILLCLAFPAVVLLPTFNLTITPLILISSLILCATGALTLKLLRDRQLNQGIISLSTGLLVAIFVFSFTIPSYNSMIGLGQLCKQAKSIALQKGIQNYYFCKISRADNLDVYLGVVPRKLRIKDLYLKESPIRKPALLFLSDKYIAGSDSIRHYINGKTLHRIGNYYFVEIDQ